MNDIRDVSSDTSLSVGSVRTIVPVGTLVHTTSGTNSLGWLQGESAANGTPASADYLVNRQGTIYKLSRPGRYAYHAGAAEIVLPAYMANGGKHYRNSEVSQALIGIELEALATQQVTREQIEATAIIIVREAVINRWRWPFYILGHYAVARPLGRRSDPVNFDWGSLAGRLWQISKQQAIGGT